MLMQWQTAADSGSVPGPGELFITSEHATPGFSAGLLVPKYRIDLRRPNAKAKVCHWVGGHGGDVVWCVHEDNTVAPYYLHELLYPDPEGNDFAI